MAPNLTSKPVTKHAFIFSLTTILCSLFFLIGYNSSSTNTTSLLNQPCLHQHHNNNNNNVSIHNFSEPLHLHFEPHHFSSLPKQHEPHSFFNLCLSNFTNHCPCHDAKDERNFHTGRHCPQTNERLRCLTPIPDGYRKTFPWPKSKDIAWFSNVPFPKLTEYKKSQNWVRLEGDHFVFPGGGTSFVNGVKGYVDVIKSVVPLKSGNIRTVLDVGCGVASFGAFLMNYNIITMSIAPKDDHEAQVQFALERGLPAMLGVLSHHRLPFPSRSFDMAHCSRCLVRWTDHDGLYLLEIDRVLRPGGYWVLSGPPINWRKRCKGWLLEAKFCEKTQNMLEDLARRMCWKKIYEGQEIAVWQKPTNHVHCTQKLKIWKSLQFCSSSDADAGWYTKMKACIVPLPQVKDMYEISGGALEKWPKRLSSVPPRVRNAIDGRITLRTFNEDNHIWKRRVSHYEVILKSIGDGKYRNVMDMNAGFGGFAAAMAKYQVWVMNVVPYDAQNNTLGIIYERGLIGAYMNWCEPFSTYPRTYDMIHAHGLFTMYMDKCDITDIVIEMQRIIRPEGSIIVRDHIDVLVKVEKIVNQMRWDGKIFHTENGAFHQEKVLIFYNSHEKN
ncbi:PREDICTED: probable methyltransferase PMT19 [Lupinus angustifolius]|uniref:probable methyltransferase PMT19 n=1 Tax=Lupinus angustifolius TaxID=3871 RepID=UPI00092FC377|nr:PREDICTED: probable methyltransferase PMT19 [Lupinus angustifolius]